MPRSEWNPDNLPAILKCMTLAIFRKNTGRESKRFTDALAAARSTLVKIKFATPASKEGPLSEFRLTAAGMKKNRTHQSDRAKHIQFNKLFDRYRAYIEMDELQDEGELESVTGDQA